MTKLYTPQTWTDEQLAGAERFDIKHDDGTPINENVQINLASSVITPGTPVTADRMNHIEAGLDAVDTRLDNLDAKVAEQETHNLEAKASVVDGDETSVADSGDSFTLKKITFAEVKAWAQAWLATWIPTTFKDVSGKLVGLTDFKINIRNTANTVTSYLVSGATASRNYTLANRDATLGNWIANMFAGPQNIPTATRTYLEGSKITVPADGFKTNTVITWVIHLSKTAAGVAASTWDIAFGETGTVSDTAHVSFVKPAGTAAADKATVTIQLMVRGGVGSSSTVFGTFNLIHNLSATGFAAVPCVVLSALSSSFDLGGVSYIGICLTTGASEVVTVDAVSVEAREL